MAVKKTEAQGPSTTGDFDAQIFLGVVDAEKDEKLKHFKVLSAVNVSDYTEKKKTGNAELTYLSWAHAFAELKRHYPDVSYKIKRFGEDQLPYQYDPSTGYMVWTEMTIEGQTNEMWLPVMDGANKPMKAEPYTYMTGFGQFRKEKVCEAANMFDINKTIMRCLVKNIAMFGLGLSIFAGEDLPFDADTDPEEKIAEQKSKVMKAQDDGQNADVLAEKQAIASMLSKNTLKMSDDEKRAFAKSIIVPAVGRADYTACNDLEKLKTLSANIEAYFKSN